MTSIQIQLFALFSLFVVATGLVLKRLCSDPLEGDFVGRMHGFVKSRNRLAVVVPGVLSAFQVSARTGALETALHHAAAIVLTLDALRAVVCVSEEGDHVDLLLLSGLL